MARRSTHAPPRLTSLVLACLAGCIGTDVGNPVDPGEPDFSDASMAPAPPEDAGAGAGEPPTDGEEDSGFDAVRDAGPGEEPSADASDSWADGDDFDDASEELPPFQPFPDAGIASDPRTDRLCTPLSEQPPTDDDPITIACRVVGGSFAPEAPPELPEELVVLVWNIERGYHLDAQIDALLAGDELPRPDVLLLSELDRGCSRTGYRDVTRELAQALEMHWVFATEFVELPREGGAGGSIDETCEHGNAILSRFPLGNVEAHFHRSNLSWYVDPETFDGQGEPRLGGRSFVQAETQVGPHRLALFSVHFESQPFPIEVQVDQASEVAERAAAYNGLSIIGGDTNAPTYWNDVRRGRAGDASTVTDETVQALLSFGMQDLHRELPYEERGTRQGMVLDLLLADGGVWQGADVCAPEVCDAMSDHRAVWARWTLPAAAAEEPDDAEGDASP